MIRVGIVGATGYGGRELLRLLGGHPEAEVVALSSTTAAGKRLEDELPGFGKLLDLTFETFDAQGLAERCDVVFLGVPGCESMGPGAELHEAGVKVIDMGPDFRLKDASVFKTYYKTDHAHPDLLNESVYGLVPWNREALKDANLVAIPGCYPIGALLPLKPLLSSAKPTVPVVIDAISGVSGAGRSLNQGFHFPEMNENVWAYKLGTHQHTPEIEQELGGAYKIQFSPHVGPYTRGILSTITVRPSERLDVAACYACYDDEPFVRVLGEGNLPQLAPVRATNFCDIGWVMDERTGNLILVSAVDNLVGGTAGIAIQCMNLMFSVDESAGLALGGMTV